jgi:hypothetical protein
MKTKLKRKTKTKTEKEKQNGMTRSARTAQGDVRHAVTADFIGVKELPVFGEFKN